MFIIIIILVINQKKYSKNKENFVLSPADLTNIRNEVVNNYDMDVDAIRNLGLISKSLLTGTNNIIPSAVGTPGTLTVPGNNIILGGLTLENSTFEKTWNSNGKGNSVGYIVSDNANYKTLMILGNNTAGGERKVSIWDELNVNGETNFTGNLNVTGNITFNDVVDQKWKSVGRRLNEEYTNTTLQPIRVCVTIKFKCSNDNDNRYAYGGYANFYINKDIIATRMKVSEFDNSINRYTEFMTTSFNIIVPIRATYSVGFYNSPPEGFGRGKQSDIELISWYELS